MNGIERIEWGRKKCGLNNKQFADKLGVSEGLASRWKHQTRFPSRKTLLAILKLFKQHGLNVTLEQLIRGIY